MLDGFRKIGCCLPFFYQAFKAGDADSQRISIYSFHVSILPFCDARENPTVGKRYITSDSILQFSHRIVGISLAIYVSFLCPILKTRNCFDVLQKGPLLQGLILSTHDRCPSP